jgi:hypothetical protein
MRFRKKPVVIDAVQWTGENVDEVNAFCGEGGLTRLRPELNDGSESHRVWIKTPEGTMAADVGDWIIKGVKGEFYPCKPDIFALTYESVEEGAPS